jgi:Rod binding domain-containing protein
MKLNPISSANELGVLANQSSAFPGVDGPKPGVADRDPAELARQFEGILVRQMLAESMKGVIDGPKGQQTYGYFISEALSDGITKGGGFGLRSVLEVQLRGQDDARRAAELHKAAFSEGPQKGSKATNPLGGR